MSRYRRIACGAVGVALLLVAPGVAADEVTVAGTPVPISKTDCQAMAAYHQPPGVDYQPGVDVNGNYVAPADLPGGAEYHLPAKIEFDIRINPINYTQRAQLQRQIAATQAMLAQNPSDTAAQRQLSGLQGQLAGISGQFDNTTAKVGHVVVDTKTGEATLDGRPMQGEQAQYLDQLCRQAGY